MVSYARALRIVNIWHKDECINSASTSNADLCASDMQGEKAPATTLIADNWGSIRFNVI